MHPSCRIQNQHTKTSCVFTYNQQSKKENKKKSHLQWHQKE